jgi:hypothetical protein
MQKFKKRKKNVFKLLITISRLKKKSKSSKKKNSPKYKFNNSFKIYKKRAKKNLK